METFLRWLSENPRAEIVLLIILIVIILIYFIALIQGREISFWPPRIGPKSFDGTGLEKQKRLDDQQTHIDQKSESHRKRIIKTVANEDILHLLKRHNDDFQKAAASRDIRYLKATSTEQAMLQNRKYLEEYIEYLQQNEINSSHLVDLTIVETHNISDERIGVTVDEVWEDRYKNGQTKSATIRNIYDLLQVNRVWLVDSNEVLTSLNDDAT